MTKKQSIRHLLQNIYGYAFFNTFTLLTPVYAIFMQSRGVSDSGLSWIIMLYSLAILITQIPVTKITNHIGQKYAIVTGQTLKTITFALWLLWPSYAGFAIGMFLWGIQYAFSETTMNTLLYDELAARGGRHTYTRALGRYYTARTLGVALSAFGSLLLAYGYGIITLLSIASLALSVMCVLNIQVLSPHDNKTNKRTHFLGLFQSGWRIGNTVPCIMNLMLLALMVANFIYLDDYFSPIAVAIGIPTKYVGIMPLSLLGASILGQRLAYKFAHIQAGLIYTAICATGGLFIVFSYIYSPMAIFILGLAYFMGGILNTLLYSRFQDSIPSRYRSILLSFYSIGSNTVYIGICGIMGLGGILGDWRYAILMMGAVLIWIGLWGALFVRQVCNSPTDNICGNGTCTAPQIGPNSVM